VFTFSRRTVKNTIDTTHTGKTELYTNALEKYHVYQAVKMDGIRAIPSTLHYLTTKLHTLHQWTKPHYSYFSRFGHQKAVLTNVLLKMGILMLETC
jgi:hypothetical protein